MAALRQEDCLSVCCASWLEHYCNALYCRVLNLHGASMDLGLSFWDYERVNTWPSMLSKFAHA